jgi:hypothetical protein
MVQTLQAEGDGSASSDGESEGSSVIELAPPSKKAAPVVDMTQFDSD